MAFDDDQAPDLPPDQRPDHEGLHDTTRKRHHNNESIDEEGRHGLAKRAKQQAGHIALLEDKKQTRQQPGPVQDGDLIADHQYAAREQLGQNQEGKARPRWHKKDYKMIDQQALRDMVMKALSTGALSELHPAAPVKQGAIVLHSVPVIFFHRLRELIDSLSAHRAIKLDYSQRYFQAVGRASSHGPLTITMPGTLHEAFTSKATQLIGAQLKQDFLPPGLGDNHIHYTGNSRMELSYGNKVRNVEGDSGIAIMDMDRPFLILECAHTQKEKDVLKKARDYLYGAKPRIKFVVIIFINTYDRPKPRTVSESSHQAVSTASAAAESQIPDTQLTHKVSKLTEHDKVSVSVLAQVWSLEPDTGIKTIDLSILIERHEVFPNHATDETFTITWADINSYTWEQFKAKRGLPDDSPEPTCDISFSELAAFARLLCDKETSFDAYEVEPQADIFANNFSPSPEAVSSSSESSGDSEEQKRRDPNYVPG